MFSSCLILILSFLSGMAAAGPASETRISVAAPHITSLIEKDQTGIYQQILGEASKALPYRLSQSYSPYKRALIMFEQQQVDCIYSFTKVMQDKLGKESVIASFPLGAFAYYMFTPHNQTPLTDPVQLEGLMVGGVHGHENYFNHRLSDKVKLDLVYKDTQNLEKLKNNRIDVMIGALPDLQPYVSSLSYSPSDPLIQSYDRITCHNNPQNEKFLSDLSVQLRKMKNTGRYLDISGDLFFDFVDPETSH